jgi:sugar phosphate isomerase/epimerase
MEIILENAPSIEWEMDVAWVVRGDADPISWINRFGDRITTAHVKDIAPMGENVDEDGWADPGHGTMDWKSCYSALTNVGVDVFVMEHDNPSNVLRFAQRAIKTFKSL